MNEYYKDIFIDRKSGSKKFRGIGLTIDKNMLRSLMVYKYNFNDTYQKINRLLFNKDCGICFSHLKFETDHEKTADYAADILRINPDITAGHTSDKSIKINCINPEYSVLANGNGISGDGSIIDIVKKIISCRSSILYFNGASVINTEKVLAGDFKAESILWGMAHITYFSDNGWSYADNNPENDYMSFCSEKGDYSIIFVNDSPCSRKYSVCLKNIVKSDTPIHCIETKGPESSSNFSANWFRVVDKILPCKKNYGDLYSVEIKPFSVMTCTTLPIDKVNGINTFDLTVKGTCLNILPLNLETDKSILPLWDIDGDFEEYSDNGKTFIEQTEIHMNISDKKSARTIFGGKFLCSYHLTAFAQFADEDNNNFIGIGICCDKNGNAGYALKIYPNGYYEILNSEGASGLYFSNKISVLHPNCLEIIIDESNISYVLNGEILFINSIGETPQAISGYGMLLSAYRRNTFSNVKIEQNDKKIPYFYNHDCLCGDFEYTEGWIKNGNSDMRFTNRTSVSTDKVNQSFEFEFIGEKAALLGITKNLRIKIEVDGSIVKAGNVAKRNSNENEAFFITNKLENSLHIIRLTVLSGSLEFDSAQTYFLTQNANTKLVNEQKNKRNSKENMLKKSTILLGAGLAAAGAGIFFVRKKFKDRKMKGMSND